MKLQRRVEIEVPTFASIIRRLRQLIRDESGPTAVEYAVMLALIIVVLLSSIALVGTTTRSKYQSIGKALDPKTDGNPDGNGQY